MKPEIRPATGSRLAELLSALSLVSDLGMAQPPEESARACLLATALARTMGLPEATVSDIYYTTLLKYLGCTAFAHEEAQLAGGDDIRLRAAGALVDTADPRELVGFFRREVGRGKSSAERVLMILGTLASGRRGSIELASSHCEVAAATARRLGLGGGVQRALAQVMERWDGKGEPEGLAGEEIELAARFALLASRAVIFHRLGGAAASIAAMNAWSGKLLDPELVETFDRHGERLLAEIDRSDPGREVVEAEPEPCRRVNEEDLDEISLAFADLVDLKVPFLRGHSQAVSALAADAARRLGWSEDQVRRVWRAGLLRDLGRVAVPNGIWEKADALSRSEWEQVRLHAYHSERILGGSAVLASIAALAGLHHERLDGSGYHRGTVAVQLPAEARLLAAADVYRSLLSERPYRRALPAERAAETLLAEAREGRLGPEEVQAVLAVAGGPESQPRTRAAWPAGLTDREVQVLRLIARGASTKRVARDLGIAPKTAGHHVGHIYQKLGVSTRAAAALFAMERGLLGPDDSPNKPSTAGITGQDGR